jgi:hypothetical protein
VRIKRKNSMMGRWDKRKVKSQKVKVKTKGGRT